MLLLTVEFLIDCVLQRGQGFISGCVLAVPVTGNAICGPQDFPFAVALADQCLLAFREALDLVLKHLFFGIGVRGGGTEMHPGAERKLVCHRYSLTVQPQQSNLIYDAFWAASS